jgi:hypothetical protein
MKAAGHHFTSSHVPEGSDIRKMIVHKTVQTVSIQPLVLTLTKPSVFPEVTGKKGDDFQSYWPVFRLT